MARDLYINGEVLVRVRSSTSSPVGNAIRELGLCSDSIVITPKFNHLDVPLDAWGGANGVAPEVQTMLAEMQIVMNLIHFDAEVLRDCVQNSLGGGSATPGVLTRAGTRLGGGVAVGTVGNFYISLFLSAPITNSQGVPWYFPSTYLTGQPVNFPIGVERTIAQVTFRAIPYAGGSSDVAAADPYNAGAGAGGKILWDNTTTT